MGHARLHLGRAHDLHGLGVEKIQDLARRARRREEAVPLARLVAGEARFGERRQLGKRRQPLAARHAERAHLAGGDVRAGVDRGNEHHRRVACQQADHRRTGTAIRHVHHLHARHRVEELAGEMRRAAAARASEADLARARLCRGDQLGHRVHRERRMHDQDVRAERHQAHRLEVLHRVVGHLLVQAGIRHQAGAGEEQGVAVGARARRDLRADVAVGAAAILDDEGLADALGERLREHAARGIDAAAGGERHDHAHRPARIALRGRGHREQTCAEQQGQSHFTSGGWFAISRAAWRAARSRAPRILPVRRRAHSPPRPAPAWCRLRRRP